MNDVDLDTFDMAMAAGKVRAFGLLNGLLESKGYEPRKVYEVMFALDASRILDYVVLAEDPETLVRPAMGKLIKYSGMDALDGGSSSEVREKPVVFQGCYVGEGSLIDAFGDFPGGNFRADGLARYPGPIRQRLNLDLVPFWGYDSRNSQNPQDSNPYLFYIYANVPGLRPDRKGPFDQLMKIEIFGKA
jgi:hypothetical protein